MSLHKHFRSSRDNSSKAAAQGVGRVSIKKRRKTDLQQNYRAEQFANDFCASGDAMVYKFCHYKVNWKCVTHAKATCFLKLVKLVKLEFQ